MPGRRHVDTHVRPCVRPTPLIHLAAHTTYTPCGPHHLYTLDPCVHTCVHTCLRTCLNTCPPHKSQDMSKHMPTHTFPNMLNLAGARLCIGSASALHWLHICFTSALHRLYICRTSDAAHRICIGPTSAVHRLGEAETAAMGARATSSGVAITAYCRSTTS